MAYEIAVMSLIATLFLAGIVALWMALRAIRKGRVVCGGGRAGSPYTVQRDARPFKFWAQIVSLILFAMFVFSFGLTLIGVIPSGWLEIFDK